MDSFRALRTYTDGSSVTRRFERLTLDDIGGGDVVVETGG